MAFPNVICGHYLDSRGLSVFGGRFWFKKFYNAVRPCEVAVGDGEEEGRRRWWNSLMLALCVSYLFPFIIVLKQTSALEQCLPSSIKRQLYRDWVVGLKALQSAFGSKPLGRGDGKKGLLPGAEGNGNGSAQDRACMENVAVCLLIFQGKWFVIYFSVPSNALEGIYTIIEIKKVTGVNFAQVPGLLVCCCCCNILVPMNGLQRREHVASL